MAPVAILYGAVVPDKGDITGYGLDAQAESELVVHLDGRGANLTFDAQFFGPQVKVVACLVLAVALERASKKGINILGFDRTYDGQA
jgi:hypothetical protein